jgi:CelD/BcsL family acetyltransferase involved in cellulose biosynthesis
VTAPAANRLAFGGDLTLAWDALADRCAADPFVRAGWISAWRASFGRGPGETLVASDGGRLTGVLPLVASMGVTGSPTNDHTPAFSLLAEDDAALVELAEALVARAPAMVSIAFLDRADPAVAVLTEVAMGAGYTVAIRPIHASPVLVLDDLAAWRAARPRRAAADLRRRRRRLAECGRTSFSPAGDAHALEDVLELERLGWKAARGTEILGDPRLGAFYRRVARWAEACGMLRVATLRLDERPIAGILALEAAGTLHLLKAGYDPDFARYSPGQLLLEDVLHGAFESGLQVVELHGADEPYKRMWTSSVRQRSAFEAFAPSAVGRLARAAVIHGRPLVRRARRFTPSHGRRHTP